MKVIENLLNSIVSLDDGRIRLQPRGSDGSCATITDAQANLPQVAHFTAYNKVRVKNLAEHLPAEKQPAPQPVTIKAVEQVVIAEKPVQLKAREPIAWSAEERVSRAEPLPSEPVPAPEAELEAAPEAAPEATENDSEGRRQKRKSRRR